MNNKFYHAWQYENLSEEEKEQKRVERFKNNIYMRSKGTIEVDNYTHAKERAIVHCKACGYSWTPVAEHLMQKCWCPKCKKEGRIIVTNNRIQ